VPGLPQGFRRALEEGGFKASTSSVLDRQEAGGGRLTKLVVGLQDGNRVEACIIRHAVQGSGEGGQAAELAPEERLAGEEPPTSSPILEDAGAAPDKKSRSARTTLCVSSQVGCKMACTFCATGTMGELGNLSAGEILEQVLHAMRTDPVRNIVFMGMGEPLNNYKAVLDAVRVLVDPRAFGLSPSRVTVSTVGVIPRILQMATDCPAVNLALSLHAPTQDLRVSIVPSAKAYPLPRLMQACLDWQEKTGKRLLVEYVVLAEVNDSLECAQQVGELLDEFDVLVNLIPWNPTESGDEMGCKVPEKQQVKRFQQALVEGFDILCTVRQEFGQEVQGACGQLALKHGEGSMETVVRDIEDFAL
jgi:adenine C2-methylase RlmN of 23S rRNA A2503 and tRNA A37